MISQTGRSWLFCSALTLLSLCLLATPLRAQVIDSRLSIIVPIEKIRHARSDAVLPNMQPVKAGLSDTELALRLALPQLWDHIVPLEMRFQTDPITPSFALVSRIVPSGKQVRVEFNAQSVFRTLRKHHIPAIVMMPHFHLVLHVLNSADLEMSQTRDLLMQEAKNFAPEWGIELTDHASSLALTWKWQGNQEVMLSLRGNSRLQEFSETRTITDADPLPVLSEWLRNILLEARDAYAFNADKPDDLHTPDNPVKQQIVLTIDRKTPLMAQVALENALAGDPRVRRVLPLSLGATRQRYLLLLQGSDSRWLPEWFERRGYRLASLPDGGWLAQ